MFTRHYLSNEETPVNDKIKEIANLIINNSNAKAKDALHLACAVYKKCDYFITCDDKLIKTINKHRDSLSDILGK
ncbi:MAG: type II toxin-antitoxin system VapC family toxin [Thermoanaerobacteraceae bacterium]|nr:type II toxin-antitoxin system VapC family toxin [Thermoanaerobacteraceae bacterium]